MLRQNPNNLAKFCFSRDIDTARQLSEILKVAPSTVSRWLRGLATPSPENLDRLADLFGCSCRDLGFETYGD